MGSTPKMPKPQEPLPPIVSRAQESRAIQQQQQGGGLLDTFLRSRVQNTPQGDMLNFSLLLNQNPQSKEQLGV